MPGFITQICIGGSLSFFYSLSCNILHLVPGTGKISTMCLILCALSSPDILCVLKKTLTDDELMLQHEENLAMINRLVGTKNIAYYLEATHQQMEIPR